ncbi:MAG: flagellar export chaperone FlgN [Phycisphaerae bacterium]|nr:MAG: hypothetical protein EDS66_00520 [Planctomycetota bacterium]KAB2946713.1 MAG: flagellar protein FlgN [Phycisphaerae bacterium]MBE7455622.1 flagellar protein FlgN [Planctomycetia bacterium]MCK6463259.1 flagellar protein FlgN [Phycisphaerae bacterium]MCL4716879.1 flagellar export chaperone FlgN [Phycisphaerae bacterium]
MTTTLSQRLRDLVRLLDDMHALHGELLSAVQDKIGAMRRADREGVATVIEREQALIERVQERESCRRMLMDAIGRELGMSPAAARKMNAAALAERLDRPSGARLLTAARSLREAASELAKVNRVAGRMSREIVAHLQRVFESIREVGAEPIGYAPTGTRTSSLEQRLVDAVG